MYKYALVLLIVSMRQSTGNEVYSRNGVGLTAFPHDIPDNVTEINLSKNYIKSIDYFEPFADLDLIWLNRNDLTSFPDLSNVSTVLGRLYLEYNSISFIEPLYLQRMTSLWYLALSHNPLASIPDVSGPRLAGLVLAGTDLTGIPYLPNLGQNIQWLDMSDISAISEVSAESVRSLEILSKVILLQLKNSPTRTIPDFCKVNHTSFDINLSGVVLSCGESTMNLKHAMDYGRVTMRPTDTPPSCQGEDGSVLSWDEYLQTLVPRGSVINRKYRRLDITTLDYFCPLEIAETTQASRARCAVYCLQAADCLMFSANSGLCTLTRNRPGTDANFFSHSPWFVVYSGVLF